MKNTKPYVPKVRDLDALVGGAAASRRRAWNAA